MKRRKRHAKHQPHSVPVLEPVNKPARKTGQGQDQSQAAPAKAAEREEPYTPAEYRALMGGLHVGDPVRAARLKQPPATSKEWNPPHPTDGVIVYIHPDGYFATVEFRGESGRYREAFMPYELARRA